MIRTKNERICCYTSVERIHSGYQIDRYRSRNLRDLAKKVPEEFFLCIAFPVVFRTFWNSSNRFIKLKSVTKK